MDIADLSIPFTDPQQAARLLDAFRQEARKNIAEALAQTRAPQRALLGLHRFLEAAPNPDAEQDRLTRDPAYARMLATLFWQSTFLANIACRNPEYLHQLWDAADLATAHTRADMLSSLHDDLKDYEDFSALCRKLRQFRKRAILRIALRDIFIHAPLPEVARELSDLANACLEVAVNATHAELAQRFGPPIEDATQREATFVILGMGKLGGRELNFSSDIDLLFFYSDDGQTRGGERDPISNAEYFHKLGGRIIKAIGEQTADGLVFRVDMRLRPHGQSGALAVSLDQAVEYYADYGRAWERQALLKARPCAGHIPLGERFIQRLRPFVFPRYFDDETLEDIRKVKAQSEAIIAQRGDTDREVKQGRGGIRDIEFTVQILQLLNGGRHPHLRVRNTLAAIEALGIDGYLTPFEADTLSRNYVYLRQVEHRIQIEAGQQAHALPEKPEALEDFALRLGYESAEGFMTGYRDRARETRAILEGFMTDKGGGTLWLDDLLEPRSAGKAGLKQLEAMGFTNPAQARTELLRLAHGTAEKPFSRNVADQFTQIAPDLLEEIVKTPAPDHMLGRVGEILYRLSSPSTLYKLLRLNPVLCRYLITLLHNSEYLGHLLMRDPSLFDTVSSTTALDRPSTRAELEALLLALSGAVEPEAAPYRLRDGEMLRVAMRELVRGCSVLEVGDELTTLAEVILAHALRAARAEVADRYGPCSVPFAILAVGKLGGWEMGYGSDMDLLFIYDADTPMDATMSATEYFAAVASKTLKPLKESTRYGTLYDIDARLRPDGAKGLLAFSHARLRQYFTEEAQEWERFALMKARAVAGDPDLMRKAENAARDAAFSLPLNRDTLDHFEDLRRRMTQQAGDLDLKKSQGGIAEVEYIVRFWQLRHGKAFPRVRCPDVYGAVDILTAENLEPDEDLQIIRESYLALRWILNRVRMQRGNDRTKLPQDGDTQRDLTQRLGIEEPVADFIAQHRARVHRLYEKVLALARESQ